MQLERHHRKLILLKFAIDNLLSKKTVPPLFPDDIKLNTDGRWVFLSNSGTNATYSVVDEKGTGGLFSEIRKSGFESHWRGVGVKAPSLKKYDEFCAELFPAMGNEFPNCVSDPEKKLGVFSFAAFMGLEAATARFLIDNHYSIHFPTFGTFSKIRSKTEKIAVKHGGVYSVYRHDQNAATAAAGYPLGVVCECLLSIRYPVPYRRTAIITEAERNGDSQQVRKKGKSLYRVRCKLNIPNYRSAHDPDLAPSEAFFRYDGFVSEKGDDWWQWLFQARRFEHENSEDLILMHCRKKENVHKGVKFRLGRMTYQDQSEELRPRSSSVVLVRHPDFSVTDVELPPSIKKSLPEIERFYSMEPGERKMMRYPRVIDLHDRASWTPIDEFAIPILFSVSGNDI